MSLCRLPILLALFCLLLVAFAERGFAEAGYLPAPFVPWLKAQGYQLKETDLEQPRPGAAQKPWERPPEKPALTPRDTLALMRALGEKPEDIDIPSPLEQSYSSRVDEPLHQFGYDLFGKPGKNQTAAENRTGLPAGTAQEDLS